jgi:hypothetical protein
VNDGVILNIGAGPEDYTIDVAAQHRPIPNARFFLQGNVANHGRTGNNPCCRMDSRTFAKARVDAGVTSRKAIEGKIH